jgi:hypothetical protein
MLPINTDNARQAEVNGGAEEGRANCQANNVEIKWATVEVIVGDHDAAHVPQDLKSQSKKHTSHMAYERRIVSICLGMSRELQ